MGGGNLRPVTGCSSRKKPQKATYAAAFLGSAIIGGVGRLRHSQVDICTGGSGS